MRILSLFLLVFVASTRAQDKPGTIPIGKDTTIVTSPLTADGYVNFAQAINERQSKGIRPEQNALTLLVQAFGPRPEKRQLPEEYFRLLGTPMPPVNGKYLTDFISFYRGKYKPNEDEVFASYEHMRVASHRPWKANEFPYLADWLETQAKPLELIGDAVQRPTCFHPLTGVGSKDGKKSSTLLGLIAPYDGPVRIGFEALTTRAMLRIQLGQTEAAWSDLIACQRLARHIGRGATVLETMVGFAGDARVTEAILMFLSETKLTEPQLQQFNRDLRSVPSHLSSARNFEIGVRYELINFVQYLHHSGVIEFADPEKPLGFLNIEWDSPEQGRVQRRQSINWRLVCTDKIRVATQTATVLAIEDRVRRGKELCKLHNDIRLQYASLYPLAAFLNKYTWWLPIRWIQDIRSRAIALWAIDLNLSGYTKVTEVENRADQYEINLRAAVALARFKLAHQRYPAKLEELVPEYLVEFPKDLFTNKPMNYSATPDGYLLYSVGINGRDDGGKTHGDQFDCDDIRVRMPMVRKQ